jgi:hypothetical protein
MNKGRRVAACRILGAFGLTTLLETATPPHVKRLGRPRLRRLRG